MSLNRIGFQLLSTWLLFVFIGSLGSFYPKLSPQAAAREAPAEAKSTQNQTAKITEKEFWTKFKKPDRKTLAKRLTPIQFKVTQEDDTERAFHNEYWDNKKPGIYVDVVSGEPLFSSLDKYKSGTGWPSFTKPLVLENIVRKVDRSLFTTRIEVRSKYADSHLGHVFKDGPKPTGLRYCLNSAALRFIPVKDLKKEGYGQFLPLFHKN